MDSTKSMIKPRLGPLPTWGGRPVPVHDRHGPALPSRRPRTTLGKPPLCPYAPPLFKKIDQVHKRNLPPIWTSAGMHDAILEEALSKMSEVNLNSELAKQASPASEEGEMNTAKPPVPSPPSNVQPLNGLIMQDACDFMIS